MPKQPGDPYPPPPYPQARLFVDGVSLVLSYTFPEDGSNAGFRGFCAYPKRAYARVGVELWAVLPPEGPPVPLPPRPELPCGGASWHPKPPPTRGGICVIP